jgi:hypothetical protein
MYRIQETQPISHNLPNISQQKRHQWLAGIVVIAVTLTLTYSGTADAQAPLSSNRLEVVRLNRQAMAVLKTGRVIDASEFLEKAKAICIEHKFKGPILSATYLNLGLTESLGNHNNAACFEYFRRAVCEDPTADVPPEFATPDTSAVMELAQVQANAPGGCSIRAGGPPTVELGEGKTPSAKATSKIIRHKPIAEQAKFVPLPVFAQINPSVRVGKVLLYYRPEDGAVYRTMEMQKHKSGYGSTLGCEMLEAMGPVNLDYYIAVLDPQKRLLATSGSQAKPYRIKAVDKLKGAPLTLPGKKPEKKCEVTTLNCKGVGELCDTADECCGNMVCTNFMCGAWGSTSGESFGDDGQPLLTAAVSVGTGFGIASGGNIAPRPDEQVAGATATYDAGAFFNRAHFRAGALFYLGKHPEFKIGGTFRGDLTFDSSGDHPTFGPAVLVNLTYKFFGEGLDGLQLHILGGLGGGVLYHHLTYDDCEGEIYDDPDDSNLYPDDGEGKMRLCANDAVEENDDGEWVWNGEDNSVERDYFRQAGYFIIEAGLEGNYWFTDNVGLNFGLVADMLVPEFALNFDLQVGLALRF